MHRAPKPQDTAARARTAMRAEPSASATAADFESLARRGPLRPARSAVALDA